MAVSKPSERKANQVAIPAGGSSYARTTRETLESIVIALILAFMFRAFEAEAFVIPTGSMAPTLQGMHKDLECPKCHFRYRVSASQESDETETPGIVVGGTCPNCRYTVETLDSVKPYNGDKILVAKFPPVFFPETFGEPKRWEVIVFRYPENAKQNYIKRLIGLPGETIRIQHGDIHVSRNDGQTFELERKPPHKVRALLQVVHDNDYLSDELHAAGVPLRWEPAPTSAMMPAWASDDGGKTYHTTVPSTTDAWLRYQHFVPTYDNWKNLERTGKLDAGVVKKQFISDFYAYNTQSVRDARHNPLMGDRGPTPMGLGLNWVGDLALEFDLDVQELSGDVTCELIKGGRRFECRLDLATGKAALAIDGGKVSFGDIGDAGPAHPSAAARINTRGKHHVQFANVDERLLLWLDGSLVEFDGATEYASLNNYAPRPANLSPAGIATRGAQVKISSLRLERDVYYIADRTFSGGGLQTELMSDDTGEQARDKRFTDSSKWPTAGANNAFIDFPLVKYPGNPDDDEFFMLGDNSPQSSDARLWKIYHFVPRKMLVGKALFIYWPASHDEIPGLHITFPFFPNFANMGFVR